VQEGENIAESFFCASGAALIGAQYFSEHHENS